MSLDVAKRVREMAQFDNLGPLTRAVIRDAPLDIDIPLMLTMYRQENRRGLIDPDDPSTWPSGSESVDEQMANYIAKKIKARFGA